jgi:DNA (cytosine-5)-methyltransferase 1
MKILPKQTSESGKERSMFSPEDSHASLLALPAEEREKKITAISGHRCYERFGKLSPLGSFVKTLLESELWWSPAKRLKWDAQTISSKRITYTERKAGSHSKKSARILKQQDIPACSVGAPHRRERIWIVAHRADAGYQTMQPKRQDRVPTPGSPSHAHRTRQGRRPHKPQPIARSRPTSNLGISRKKRALANTLRQRSHKVHKDLQPKFSDGKKSYGIGNQWNDTFSIFQKEDFWKDFPTQSPVCRGNDGIPFDVDHLTISFPRWRQESIKAYGNAWVPQVAYEIFRAIEAETT